MAACLVVVAAAVPGCASGESSEPTASPSSAPASADATEPSGCPAGGCDLQEARTLTYRDGGTNRTTWELEVVAPTQEGAWPVVVLAHGGSDRLDFLRDWATGIAGQGAATYNVTYPTIPGQVEDSAGSLACALRVAVDDAVSQGADTSRVVVVGISIGGMIGAAVSLGSASASPDCVIGEGDVLPDAFVGYEGVYDWSTDPGFEAGDPYSHIGGNSDLVVRLLTGDVEDLVPMTVQEEFAQALDEAGYDVEATVVEGGQHAVVDEGTPAYQAVVDQVSDVLNTL